MATAGHHEPNIYEMRKRVEQTTRQLANEKRQLAEREKALRADDDEVFARELHAALCISLTCGGWEDADVRRDWLSFAVSLLMPGGTRLERSAMLDLASQFATSPFYQSIRSFQQQLTGGPGDASGEPQPPDLVAGPEPSAPVAGPDTGPPASSQEPQQAAAAPSSTSLLELTDDDIPF